MSRALWSDEQEKPLQHLRVVDLTTYLAGPYLTRIFVQYGADVVKVEAAPHGDPLRQVAETALFDLLNQGKRSLGVDFKNHAAIALVKQLAAESDVFVENFVEGVAEEIGLGYAELSEENPDLIYVSLRGLSGKFAGRASHDLNQVAHSGVGEWALEPGNDSIPTQFAAIAGGVLHSAVRLLVHLSNPARRGMHLVCSADEAYRALYLPRAFDAHRAESLAEAAGAGFGFHRKTSGTLPHTRYYRCRDGQFVALNALQENHWQAFCEAIDRADWKNRHTDPTLVAELSKLFSDAPASYWEALTTSRDFCLSRVVPWSEHYSFSQARAQLSSDPLAWAGFAPSPSIKAAPALGADSFAIAHSLGHSHKHLSDWFQAGTLLGPTA